MKYRLTEEKPYLSPSLFAERFDVSTKTVHRQLKAGRLPAVKIGGQWRIDMKAFCLMATRSRDTDSPNASGDTEPPDEVRSDLQPAGEQEEKTRIPGPKPSWMKGRFSK